MSYKTFKSPCERMRFRALRDGDGSEADKAWRKHAAGCKECQASLHIMQLLQGTPSSEELSLPEENVAQLKQMVEERYGNASKNRRQMVLSLLLMQVNTQLQLYLVQKQLKSQLKLKVKQFLSELEKIL